MINDKFTETYLNSLNIVKQNEDEDQKLDKECGDVASNSDDTIISDDVDEQAEEDLQIDDDDEVQTDDSEIDDSLEQDQGEEEQGEDEDVKCFCFKTINKDLIDIINSGFDKVVFTVKATDDEGKDTTTDVEISADAFEDFGECECDGDEDEDLEDIPDEQSDEEIPEDEEFGDVEEGQEEASDDEEDTTFESVFKKYYNSLISEGTEEDLTSDGQTLGEEADICPECGKEPCECDDVCPECGKKECTCEAVEEKEDKITKKTVKSAQEVQKLIEKDFGKKSKPWDTKQVKKVAFKNGKLFAASNDGKKWFNKQNKSVEL